jgi:hypothetical protein
MPLSPTYKILSNILLSRLAPYIDEIIEDHQYGFQYNRSITDKIFCICQILEKKLECNRTAHHLFYKFQESLEPIQERSIVQYSQGIWYTCETS